MVENMSMTRSYKALALRAMIDAGFPERIKPPNLAKSIAEFACSDSKIKKEIDTNPSDVNRILSVLKKTSQDTGSGQSRMVSIE